MKSMIKSSHLYFVMALSLFSGVFAAEQAQTVKVTTAPKFPNSKILNQDGKSVKFYDDLIKGKLVAINFVFSSCPTICPVMQVKFAQLQKEMKKAGVPVQLISVTVDPVTDTPVRLKKWGKQFGAGDNWTYVTGKKQTIDKILKKLEVFTADISDHASFIIMGSDTGGDWKRVNSLAGVEVLAKELTALSAAAESKSKAP